MTTQAKEPDPVHDFSSSQWWFKELEALWNSAPGAPVTADMKRAAFVAMHLMKAVERDRAKPIPPIIKLVGFKPRAKWSSATAMATTFVEDAQTILSPGEPFEQQHLLDHALECVWNGDLVSGAAMLHALASQNNLLLPETDT